MKIAIDAFPLMMKETGIGIYTDRLLCEFFRLAPQHDYYLCDLLFQSYPTFMEVKKDPSEAIKLLKHISETPFPLQTMRRIYLSFYTKMINHFNKIGEMDIFWGTNFKGIFREKLKTVITIHDMAHEYYPEAVEQRTLQYLKRNLPETAKKAALIIADSQNTQKDILKFLKVPGARVKVIYPGVDKAFLPIKDTHQLKLVQKKYDLPQKFILYLGAIQPRKNIAGLIRAYSNLCQDPDFKYALVIAGGVGWKSDEIPRLIEKLELKRQIIFTGYIAPPDLPVIYNLAEVFLFPSFYEGFGLPVLEAMACGIPVVTSNVSSLPEVAGDAAVYIDPHSVDDIANGIRRILSDEDLRNRCIKQGSERAKLFTWEKCARETLKVFNEVV